jgi:hypothetical protein
MQFGAAAIKEEGKERGDDTTGRNVSCDEGGAPLLLLIWLKPTCVKPVYSVVVN